MHLGRRQMLSLVAGALAGVVGARAHSGTLTPAGGMNRVPTAFPPFELQASPVALRRLTTGLVGWRVERQGRFVSNVWLKSDDGTVWLVGVDQRDLRPLFEVFTLAMVDMAGLQERWESWRPPVIPPGDLPEGLRELLTARPPAPVAPVEFEQWPFRSWRTEVVRRAEFIVEGAEGPTFGNNPNTQAAARPRAVPPDAAAYCEVAAGVLFTSPDDHRLLLAVDWMPMDMIVSQEATEIDTFISECELISMEDYLAAPARPT